MQIFILRKGSEEKLTCPQDGIIREAPFNAAASYICTYAMWAVVRQAQKDLQDDEIAEIINILIH